MPHVDGRSGDIVIRIVYDGAPEAGKTTNVQQLVTSISLQRRGALESPESKGRRTEFFDWLDFAGGFVDGRRIRCQLVTVPGQTTLLHRRRYLIETADAIVFVADSGPDATESVLRELGALRRILGGLEVPAPIGLIVQANKQDREGALSPHDLAARLSLPADAVVVPAVASQGRGVMDTFVLAARFATDRVRALVLDGRLEALPPNDTSAAALHASMVRAEQALLPPPPEEVSSAAPVPSRLLPNDVGAARLAHVPRADELPAGHVWPSVRGRALVAAAVASGAPIVPEQARTFSPHSPVELQFGPEWVLQSSRAWLFDSETAARHALIATVRACVVHAELVPEGRAIFLSPEGGPFRLWVLSRVLPTLADGVESAMVAGDGPALLAAFGRIRRADAELRRVGHSGLVARGAEGVAEDGGRFVILTVQGPDPDDGGALPLEAHARSIAEACAIDVARKACLARTVQQLDAGGTS